MKMSMRKSGLKIREYYSRMRGSFNLVEKELGVATTINSNNLLW